MTEFIPEQEHEPEPDAVSEDTGTEYDPFDGEAEVTPHDEELLKDPEEEEGT